MFQRYENKQERCKTMNRDNFILNFCRAFNFWKPVVFEMKLKSKK